MKANEWAEKFNAVPVSEAPVEERFADLLKEFGVETAELIVARTKTSKPETRFGAVDGAVREQRNKFCAVCRRVPALIETLFDFLLVSAVPDYTKWQAEAKKKAEKPLDDDVRNYRKISDKKFHKKQE